MTVYDGSVGCAAGKVSRCAVLQHVPVPLRRGLWRSRQRKIVRGCRHRANSSTESSLRRHPPMVPDSCCSNSHNHGSSRSNLTACWFGHAPAGRHIAVHRNRNTFFWTPRHVVTRAFPLGRKCTCAHRRGGRTLSACPSHGAESPPIVVWRR